MADLFVPASAPLGDFRASVYYSKFLGTQAIVAATLRNGLAGKLPEGRDPAAGKMTTSPGMPIVQSWELTKMSGDRVTVDMKGRFTAEPQINDSVSTDRKETLRYARDEVRLSLYTHVGDPGGIMTRQRNPHDTRMDVMDGEIRWLCDLEDNLFMVHAYGARGDQTGTHWIIPPASSSNFQNIIGNSDGTGNPVLPPTRTRYSLPGNATGLDDLDPADQISLDFLTRLRARINTSNVPLEPISSKELMTGMEMYTGGNKNLYVGLIDEEQYVQIKTEAGANGFSQMVTAANTRLDFNNHPAFADLERFMWAGIIWMKCPRSVRFNAGSQVQQYNATTGALETVTVATRAVRGIVLGAQAIGVGYGDANPPPASSNGGSSGTGETMILKSPYSWREDVRQGGGVLDIYARMMAGYKKLRYSWPDYNGGPLVSYDNGVHAFDTASAGF